MAQADIARHAPEQETAEVVKEVSRELIGENELFWGGAAISMAAASGIFYRYVAPRSWREWTRAEIMQVFIIAFYAEMSGFPVTIYLLARIFNLDVAGSCWDGNL